MVQPLYLKTKNKIILLVEEYDDFKNRCNSKVSSKKIDYKIISRAVILTDTHHLSFPNIYKSSKELYVYPENSKSGSLYMYSFSENLESLVDKKIIINEPILDPVIIKLDNSFFLFGTNSFCKFQNTILIYKSDQIKSEYKLFQKILLNDSSARSAGNFFKIKDKIIRPAQDCNGSYGKGIVLQEIKFDNNKFSIVELKRIYSNSSRYPLGIHTINIANDLIVVDILGYKNIFFGKLFKLFKSIFK